MTRLPIILLIAFVLTACGGSSTDDSSDATVIPGSSPTPSAMPSPSASPTPTPSPTPVDGVANLYALAPFPVGASMTTYTNGGRGEAANEDVVRDDSVFGDLRRSKYLQHHNSISPRNAFKWKPIARNYHDYWFGPCQKDYVPRVGDEPAFDTGDAECWLEYAEENGIDHVNIQSLIWYFQTPNWIRGGNLQKTYNDFKQNDPNFSWDGVADRNEYLYEMEYHIEQMVCQFADRVDTFVVVNEAFSDYGYAGFTESNPTGLRVANDRPEDDHTKRVYWVDEIGKDYIELAFRKAQETLDKPECRQSNNEVDLYINDYQVVVNTAKREVFMDYMNDFTNPERVGGLVPIDGIGIQMHYNTDFNSSFTPENVRAGVRELVSTGLKIRFTEIDVQGDLNEDFELSESELENQKRLYKDLITIYMEEVPPEQRGGITFWGMSDRDSWLSYTSPLLFDEQMQEKPAIEGVAEGFKASFQGINLR